MKRFLQGLLTGALIVGAMWGGFGLWSRFGMGESDALQNVVKAALEAKLSGSQFLEITMYREVPPDGSDFSALSRKSKHFEVEAIYRRSGQIKRMLMPVFLEDGSWLTPHADALEKLDSQGPVTFNEGSNKHLQPTPR